MKPDGVMGVPVPTREGTARIVEAPSMLWHLRRDGEHMTLCGDFDASNWPHVLHWQTQTSITCGRCLFALGVLPAEKKPG